MAKYQIVIFDDLGHFLQRFDWRCDTDEEACSYASTVIDRGTRAEVWSNILLIGNVPPGARAPHKPAFTEPKRTL